MKAVLFIVFTLLSNFVQAMEEFNLSRVCPYSMTFLGSEMTYDELLENALEVYQGVKPNDTQIIKEVKRLFYAPTLLETLDKEKKDDLKFAYPIFYKIQAKMDKYFSDLANKSPSDFFNAIKARENYKGQIMAYNGVLWDLSFSLNILHNNFYKFTEAYKKY